MCRCLRIIAGLPPHPLLFWRVLHPSPRAGFFFGSSTYGGVDRALFMSAAEPSSVFQRQALNDIEKKLSASARSANVPRFVGVLGFEAGRDFDRGIGRLAAVGDSLEFPRQWFGDFPAVVKIDLERKTTALYWNGSRSSRAEREAIRRFERAVRLDRAVVSRKARRAKKIRFSVPPPSRFSSMVKQAKQAIGRGDIYQANLSLRFQARPAPDPLALYERLCEVNPSPYACLMKLNDRWIVSCSPELLVEIKGSNVKTRPIAGTRPRGNTREKDRRRSGQLLLSPKERAEHIMLVDLERNDLGRVCKAGSVNVTERAVVERYSHVMHIVSQVEGKLSKQKTSADALRALFPGGTITGCPKIRSIELIEKIEGQSRGPFYGSAGYFCANGDATFNILIRTALIQRGRLFLQAGAGIVADSRSQKEYKEVLAKARALVKAAATL